MKKIELLKKLVKAYEKAEYYYNKYFEINDEFNMVIYQEIMKNINNDIDEISNYEKNLKRIELDLDNAFTHFDITEKYGKLD